MRRQRLAVFGGSFNPPHLGHALMPAYLFARGLADQVLVAPCYAHAFGKDLLPFVRRLAMVEAAMADYPARKVWVSDIEGELARAAEAPNYTLHLLEALKGRFPDHDLRLVVGSDITASGETEKWHRWDLISERYDPIVVPRAGFCDPGEATLPELQSRDIRRRLAVPPNQRSEADARSLELSLPAAVLRLWDQPTAGRLWIVGSGNVAGHLVRRLRSANPHWEVRQLGARELLSRPRETLAQAGTSPTGVWVLARDHATKRLAEALVRGGLSASVPILQGGGSTLSTEGLAAWREQGGPAGTLHPICSLRRERPRSQIENAGWGIEGDPAARELALRIVGDAPWLDLGRLDREGRAAYHAACALVANHLAVLVAEGEAILNDAIRVDDAVLWRVLDGLVYSSVDNLMALGLPQGVSGPVARGELEVAEAHALALGGEAGALYRHLSQRLATRLAMRAQAGVKPDEG